MCENCGCSVTGSQTGQRTQTVDVLSAILAENDRSAAHNRAHLDRHAVLAVNLMSSPGAGKTRLLEATAAAFAGHYSMAAIVGDLATENDATRLRGAGLEALQISTGSACHLDAAMVHEAMHQLDLDGLDVLFIENVGNLVCPAAFDLGQHLNVVLLAVTEGDDKPAKYPVMFRAADLVVLSKTDLLPHLTDFRPARARRALAALGSEAPLVQTALATPGAAPEGIAAWLAWLQEALHIPRGARAAEV